MALSKRFHAVKSERTQGIPYKSEIANFVRESRKCQTLLSSYEPMIKSVFQYNKKRELLDFVNFQLFSEKLINVQLHKNDNEMTELVCEKIINVSKELNPTNIQLSVVWVICFSYDNNKSFNVPVFKCTNRNRTKYIDIYSVSYEKWDHVVEQAVTVRALLCFPRHGTYSFQNDQVDLEYVLSQCVINEINSSPRYSLETKPFCQVVLCSWFQKLNLYAYGRMLKEFIKEYWVLLIFCAFAEYLGFSNFLMEPFFLKIFKNILPLSPNNISKISDLIYEGKKLLSFFSAKKKLWIPILNSLCCLTATLRSMCGENSTPSNQINGTTPALRQLPCTSTISASPKKNFIEGGESRQKSVAADYKSVTLENNLKVPQECDTKAQELKEELTLKILENLLSALTCLKKTSSSDAVNIIPNDDQSKLNNNVKRCIELENYILSEEKKKYKIYLCSKQHINYLIQTEFAGKKITLEIDESGNYTLFDSQGISMGKLFFPFEFYGICLFVSTD